MSVRLHLKSEKKREDGKSVKEIISQVDNHTERRIIKDRSCEKTQATFIVWRDGELHHIHDKTYEKIELWKKDGNRYWDKEGNIYMRTASKDDKGVEVFIDKNGKEYRFLSG